MIREPGRDLPLGSRMLLETLSATWTRVHPSFSPDDASLLKRRALATFERRRTRLGVKRWHGKLTAAGVALAAAIKDSRS